MWQLVDKRKVTLKSSWMEESDQFRVSRPSPPQSERPKCPTCDIPLRTSQDGGLFCWICGKGYDPAQLKAGQVQKAPDRTCSKDVNEGKGNDDDEFDDDQDFELDGTNEGEVDDEAEEPPAPDDGTEEVEGAGMDGQEGTLDEIGDEEDLEFVLDEETPSEDEDVKVQGAADVDAPSEASEKAAGGKGSVRGDEWTSDDEEMDFELSDEEADEDWSDEDAEIAAEKVPSGAEKGKGEDGGASEEDDGIDFELELGPEDGNTDEEGLEPEPGTEGQMDGGPPKGHRTRKRFVDQSEVEFD